MYFAWKKKNVLLIPGQLVYFGFKYNEHISCLNMYYIFKGKGLLFIYFQGDKFSVGKCVDLGFLNKKNLFQVGDCQLGCQAVFLG